MQKKNNRTFGKILMTLMIIFFYLPILYMIIFSFNEGKSLTSFTGFSMRWYQHMLASHDMMESLYTTFGVAFIATAVSTVVGTIAAIGLSKSKKIVRDLMDQVNNLPLMNPEIVTAIGFMLLFITFRVEKGYVTLEKSDADKRNMIIVITDKGRRWGAENLDKNMRFVSELYADISERDIKTFAKVQQKLLNKLYVMKEELSNDTNRE